MSRSQPHTPSTPQQFGCVARRITAAMAISLFAGTPIAAAQTTWTAGSTVTLNSTFVVSDTLTIEPGVTVELATNAQFIIGPDGVLLVNGTPEDPVLFTPQVATWPGMLFQPGSEGEITGAIIEHCFRYAIEIIGASPLIQTSTIRGVGTPTAIFSGDAAGIRVRETSPDQLAHPIILSCVIEDVTGFRGFTGSFGSSGSPGDNGADGGAVFQNGGEGGNGSAGFTGGLGGVGPPAYGVYISNGAQATIGYNIIRAVRGGKGGTGGQGGIGGWGGRGGHGFNGFATGGNGGPGGRGGQGGPGGRGGSGGNAEAIRAESTQDQVYVFQNLIHNIEAGPGGDGGRKGTGGSGGNGGNGGDCSSPFCAAGNGGNGLAGGPASQSGGSGFNAGFAALATASGAGPLTFVNNTVADLRRGVAGDAGPGGFGGQGGSGGLRGIASGSGTNGTPGSSGPAGANSGPGAPGDIGFIRGVSASNANAQVQLFNNIIALDGAGTMLESGFSALITADHNNFFGFSTLTQGPGSTALGTNNVEADPIFAEPGQGNFRVFGPDSPAIDAGSNALVPEDFLDLNNNADTTEPIPFDLDGNPRIADGNSDAVATVDMGAYEGTVATLAYRRAADLWLAASPSSESYAFDEFVPGVANGGGCLLNDPTQPVVLELDGGVVTVSALQNNAPVCALIDASTTPAVSDANLNNANADGLVVFEFDPPVTGFYTYLGSLATDQTATMHLYTSSGAELTLLDSITSLPSPNAVAASGFGFRSAVPIHRVEITATELGQVLVGAFNALVTGEPSLGTVQLSGYSGPTGETVQHDFACSFVTPQTCPPDVTGDGAVNFADLNAILSAFGQTGPDLPADTNNDGAVNFADLNAVLTSFGESCPS